MEHLSGAGPATRAVLDVGSVIADTYRIEALLGRGGMGAVFLASHLRLPGKRVAIKLLHAGEGDPELLARFRREAEIATRLGHPNIVEVHDFNLTPDGTPYLVLEHLEGITLAQRIAAGPMRFEDVSAIVRQLGGALTAAHAAEIVHRDLKPQNVFLVMTDVAGRDVEVAKVLDFGISKIRGSTTVKPQESALLGTPQSMAPEQATGRQDAIDQRTDQIALGAIVHEMLGGRPAFMGASIPEVVFKVVYEPPTPLPADAPTASWSPGPGGDARRLRPRTAARRTGITSARRQRSLAGAGRAQRDALAARNRFVRTFGAAWLPSLSACAWSFAIRSFALGWVDEKPPPLACPPGFGSRRSSSRMYIGGSKPAAAMTVAGLGTRRCQPAFRLGAGGTGCSAVDPVRTPARLAGRLLGWLSCMLSLKEAP